MNDNKRRPLNILQVITQRRYSGAERICLIICSELQKRGHRVKLLCKPGTILPEEARKRGINVETPAISGKLNLMAPFRIAAIAREFGADIIHTHLSTATLMGSIAGKMSNIPVLGHVHALNNWHNFRLCSMVATCSAGVARHIQAQGAPPERVRIALNGIELNRFKDVPNETDCRRMLAVPENVPVIGCVAHLSAKKGQSYLIRAVAQLKDKWPNLQCMLIGEGEMKEELAGLAAELGITDRVHLLGYREDAVAVMNACDIAVLPSVAKEGLGLVLVEAALLGKPVIGSNAPGIDEALENGISGLLFPPGDSSALAAMIDQLLSDPQLQEKMGQAGHQRALEMFTAEAMANRIEDIYYELLEKTRA